MTDGGDWISTTKGPVNMAVMAYISVNTQAQPPTYVVHLGPGAFLALDVADTQVLRDWAAKRKVKLPSMLTVVQ